MNRACDACRRRKVKCDSSQDCPNCRVAGLECTYSEPPKKRGPKPNSRRRDVQPTQPPSTPTQPADLHFLIGTWPNSTIPDAREAWAVIRHRLLAALNVAAPSRPPQRLVQDCISLHLQFIFPIGPIFHEASLRRDAASFFPEDSPLTSPDDPEAHLASLRAFARLVCLCAHVTSTTPASLLAVPGTAADAFLRAAHASLRLLEEYDLEHPSSASTAARVSLACALHNKGHTTHSWHLLAQAILLSHGLLPGRTQPPVDPLEAQLRCSLFWSLQIANRSAAVLNDRPVLLAAAQLPPSFRGPDRIPLLCAVPPLEDHILAGTDLCYRLWSTAWDLLAGIHDCALLSADPGDREPAVQKLVRAYVSFSGILDDLPPWLQTPDQAVPSAEACQRGTFWRLRVDITVTFHCLRMVLLQRCAAAGLVRVMGLSEEPLVLEMRTAEIARDCLDSVDAVPFEFLQVNGEPLMEKFRQIGSALLELSQKTSNDLIRKRAKTYLSRLLNLLARLDSKAVDELTGDSPNMAQFFA